MVIIGADATQAEREFIQVQVAAAAAAAKVKIATKVSEEGQKHWNGVIREGLVLLREIGRGNWTRVPGSASLFIQRLNDQLPFLKSLLNPLTAAFAALVTVAVVGLIKMTEHFRTIQASATALDNIVGGVSNTFKYMGDAAEESSKKLQKLNFWLEHFHDTNETIASQADERIEQMKAEFEWQQKIADKQGQTPEQKNAAEIAEQKKEEQVLADARTDAFTDMNNKEKAAKKAGIAGADEFTEANSKDSEARRAAAKGIYDSVGEQYRANYGSPGARTANDPSKDEKFKVKGADGKELEISLNEATKANTEASRRSQSYNDRKQKRDEDATKTQRDADKAKQVYEETKKKDDKALLALHNQEKYGADFAKSAETKGGHNRLERGHVNSLQQIGAYANPAQVQMVDISKRQLSYLKGIHDTLNGKGGHKSSTATGVNYGDGPHH
jgi:hypothetical protein